MTTPAHRLGSMQVTLTDSGGAPITGPVAVEQLSHDFGFGNIGFELVSHANGEADDEKLAEAWLGVFNQATLPFYWRDVEPHRGDIRTPRLAVAARWFAERGVRVKGHPLLWHTLAPAWLLDLNDAEVEAEIRARITRDAGGFAGLIDHWDVINEAVILPRFTAEHNAVTRLSETLGRVGMVRLAVDAAREANPNVKLVLNDFLLTDEYAQLISVLLDDGVRLDAIGLQTHMHQGFRGEDELGAILEQFGRFGLPLQLTETTLVSGELMPADIIDLNDYQVERWVSTPEGEARQASELERHYRTCVAHPLVESITYWGLRDGDMWLGAPAGLLHPDNSPKPAYDALVGLVKGEWWVPPTTLVPSPDGVVTVSGWGGTYRMASATGSAEIRVVAGESGRAAATL